MLWAAATYSRSSLIAGNLDDFQRPIFDGRFRIIVVQGTSNDTTSIIPPEYNASECIIVARWKAKYRAFKRVARA